MDERKAWERLDGEPMLWFNRFSRFRRLGPERSLLAAYNQWRGEKGRERATGVPEPWARARDGWDWIERAEDWDLHLEQLVDQRHDDARIEALTSGFALQYERVRELDSLAKLLLEELLTEDKRWVPDVKAIGSGKDDTFERIDIVRFNSALIREFRETLADLAAEQGERIKGLDVTSGGEKVQPNTVVVREYLSDGQQGG